MSLFTIVICTYNGEHRLPLVLSNISQLNNPQKIDWEVIVVDNNSSDKTKEIVNQFQQKWCNCSKLRYFFEPKQGLAYARQRGVEEAKSELIGFLDDDNIPAPNWIEEALLFAQQHPQSGAFGSEIEGDFEIDIPHDFGRIACFLAIINRGDQQFNYQWRKGVLPPAAGLVIKRQVWLDYVPNKLFLIGRVGNSMLASEDLEALVYIQQSGKEIWHNPKMKIKHKIPPYRLKKEYLISLVRGIGLARSYIRMLRIKPYLKPLFTILFFINDLRKLIMYNFKPINQNTTELVKACEREFLISTIQSPFYLLTKNKS